jgi:C-terminal processing protease CtpA/Prc
MTDLANQHSDFVDRLFRTADGFAPRERPIWTAAWRDDADTGSDEEEDTEPPGSGTGRWLSVGMTHSLVEPLGTEVWKLAPEITAKTRYTAAIYQLADGRQVGFIRVPRYSHDRRAAAEFVKIIDRFNASTTALIFDQTYNPGGSLFQMYALLANLTAQALPVPLHEVKLGEDDAAEARDVLDRVEYGDQLPQQDRPTPELIQWSRFVVDHVKKGPGVLSERVPLFGVSHIEPAPNPYTKPIFVLINELTFSAAEFLAAILQDNQLATLVGVRTAGAGGCAKTFQLPPGLLDDMKITLTWTVAWRTNGNPIENVGVHPDIHLEMTPNDIRNNNCDYRQGVLAAIDSRA